MRFSALLFCCLYGSTWTSNNFCVLQLKTLSVKEGESATIPCTYTFTNNWGKSQITVNWWETDETYCSVTNKTIIDLNGNVIDKYKGRLSRVKDPEKNQAESIIIRGLKASDGRTFCCSATISQDGKEVYTWHNVYGTILNFADVKLVTQFDDLIAVLGEQVTIPCYYPQELTEEAYEVIWDNRKSGSSLPTSNQTTNHWNTIPIENNFQFSIVNFPTDVSLRIHNVSGTESSFYRCGVATKEYHIESRLGTELTIAGSSSSPFSVTQPDTITGHRGESVTLNCSYSPYRENDVLGVDVYWRVGNITGPYVYHPYKEMVHPSYRRRAEIKGPADLHIRGLQMSDDSTYYCFVMLKLCTRNDIYGKLAEYGEGTRLQVSDHDQQLQPNPLIVIFAVYISIKAFMVLIIWILMLLLYK